MKKKIILVVVFAGLVGLIFGLALSVKLDIFSSVTAQSQEQAPEITPALNVISIEDAIINVASVTGKAVVSISTEHTEKMGNRMMRFNQPFGGGVPGQQDESFKKFFEDFFGQMPERE